MQEMKRLHVRSHVGMSVEEHNETGERRRHDPDGVKEVCTGRMKPYVADKGAAGKRSFVVRQMVNDAVVYIQRKNGYHSARTNVVIVASKYERKSIAFVAGAEWRASANGTWENITVMIDDHWSFTNTFVQAPAFPKPFSPTPTTSQTPVSGEVLLCLDRWISYRVLVHRILSSVSKYTLIYSNQDAALEASWPDHKPQSICVIGAGPSGLSALKIIRDSAQYQEGLWTATAFETRENVGGIW